MSISEASPLAITGFITIFIGFWVLVLGITMAKRKQYANHKNFMWGAVIVNAIFLVLYVIRFAIGDETHFSGPTAIRDFVYFPILTVHILFAIISIVLIFWHLKQTYRGVKWQENDPYFEKEYRAIHRKMGRITFFFWFFSYLGGITVFLLLYVLF